MTSGFLARSWPTIACGILLAETVRRKVWPAVAFSAVITLYVIIRHALFEHHLLVKEQEYNALIKEGERIDEMLHREGMQAVGRRGR